MRQDYIKLVYIINNANIKGFRVIKKLQEYGGYNVECLTGTNETSCYFITPENVIYSANAKYIVPILELAGYKDITAEFEITEYTIEEIAKLLGKDPDSIRIKK